MTSVKIRVNGSPAPQGSKTIGRYGGMYESSKKVGPWRNAVRTETQRVCSHPFSGPVEVIITFYLVRPKGHYGTGKNAGVLKPSSPAYPKTTPDVDKMTRAVFDGLKDGGAFRDDAQVVDLHATKRYADQQPPGADICITLM